ncbi:MAG TPA: multicopper oxidase domain-containing protein, partial [Thermoanaerobaculia bacterium]|nr:multicopper oxidase domain-containing protein [Thermoanaerobaculia bacterium]
MPMIRRSVVVPFVLFLLLVALAASAQTKKKPSTRAATKLPPGAVELQGVVLPGCGARGKEELRKLNTVEAKNGVLSTTLEVWPNNRIKVPVFNTVTGKCEDKTFAGRMYKDPVSHELTFPGPTLRVRRADETHKGDSIRVLLDNHLAPSADFEKCVWKDAGRQLCDCPKGLLNPPQCCFETVEPTGMNCFHGSNTTNLHFHGLHVSPQKPQDWVFLELSPHGQEFPDGKPRENQVAGHFLYEIDPLNERQPEGTHWYHPHKHGATAEQVGNGMAGALIVEGPFDDWLQAQYGTKLVEKVMILQQVHDLNFTSVTRVGRQFPENEESGKLPSGTPMPLINGQLVPRITMNPGEIQRWRLISATMEASAQLVIDLDGRVPKEDAIEVRQIAMDGVQFSPVNYRCQPLLYEDCPPEKSDQAPPLKPDPKFQLSPGNRADFLVKAPSRREAYGTYVLIPYEVIGAVDQQGQVPGTEKGTRKKAVQRALTRKAQTALAPGDLQAALLAVYICRPGGNKDEDKGCVEKSMKFPEPKDFHPLPPFLSRPIKPTRYYNVQFQILDDTRKPSKTHEAPEPPFPNGRFGVQMSVNKELQFMQFDPRCANFTAPLDSSSEGGEEWHISQNINANEGAPPFHVFHIHTNPFQVVGTEKRG